MKSYRPELEVLEGRVVPSGSSGECVLGPALTSGSSGSGNSGSGSQSESRSVFDTDLTSTSSAVVGEAKLETRTRNGVTEALFKVELANAPTGTFPISITVGSNSPLTGSIVVANGVGQFKLFSPSFDVSASESISVTVDFGTSGGVVTLQGTFQQKR